MSAARPDMWMPFYWGDYLRDTGHLSAAEHGGYMLLIGHYWTTGKPLPSGDAQLRRIARMDEREWTQAKATIAAFFQQDGDTWTHGRIEKELRRSQQITDQRATAGRASAQRRASKPSTGVAAPLERNDQQTGRPSQPQPQPPSQSEAQPAAAREPEGKSPEPEIDAGRGVIELFDRIGEEIFGHQRRPFPAGDDIVFARRWITAGADIGLLEGLFRSRMGSKRSAGEGPITSLKFFDGAVNDAIRKAQTDIPDFLRRRDRPTRPQASDTAKELDDVMAKAGFGDAA